MLFYTPSVERHLSILAYAKDYYQEGRRNEEGRMKGRREEGKKGRREEGKKGQEGKKE